MKTENIKNILSEFIKDSLQTTNKYDLRDGTEVNINRAVYQIQHHLAQELENYKINTRLDAKIISESILKSFSSEGAVAHSAYHYVFPFLKYTYHNFRSDRELLDYIDGFIELNKQHLTWQDIVVTKTGVTRCKTNIRFALNTLRELHLVKSRTEDNRRTVMPTVIGQLLVHYFNSMNPTRSPVELDLSTNGYLYFISHLRKLEDPLVLTRLLDGVTRTFKLSQSNAEKLDKYLNSFINDILPNISITDQGIKYSKKAMESPKYKELLTQLNRESIILPPSKAL